MGRLILAIVAVIFISSTSASMTCPAGWILQRRTFSCYKYFSTQETYADARITCTRYGGYLATIRDPGTKDFISSNVVSTNMGYWIGLNRISTGSFFRWNNEQVQTCYTFWHQGEPNNLGGIEACVNVNRGIIHDWNDLACEGKLAFLCERGATISL